MDKKKSYTNKSVGMKLCMLRKKAGLTQLELAAKLNVSRSLIAEYERGTRRLHDEILIKIANLLKVSVDEILGLKNNKSNDIKPSLRFIKRLKKIEKLPETRKKEILRIIDDLIYASEKK